jgi:hypothetical protein
VQGLGDSAPPQIGPVLDSAVSRLDAQSAALERAVGHDLPVCGEARAEQCNVVGMQADEPLVVGAHEERDCALDAPHQSRFVKRQRRDRRLAERRDGVAQPLAQFLGEFLVEPDERKL